MELHRNARRVVEAAAAAGLEIQVREHPGARTAQEAADRIGCPVGAIVKSIVLASDAGPVLVLTAGDNQVDYGKVAAALGCGGVRRADADEVRAATGFPIGGTAPLGHPQALPVLCDQALLRFGEVWAAAGTPDLVFPAEPRALAAAAGAVLADVAAAS